MSFIWRLDARRDKPLLSRPGQSFIGISYARIMVNILIILRQRCARQIIERESETETLLKTSLVNVRFATSGLLFVILNSTRLTLQLVD